MHRKSKKQLTTNQQLIQFLTAIISCLCVANAIPVDNGVIGTPTIECGTDDFTVNFKTEKPFLGNVYAKGFFDSSNCKVGATQSTDVTIKLKYNTLANCGVRRRRMTNPRGMAVTDTVVIMFHPMFLTKVDRAYRVECMYMEGAKVLTHSLDVSMLTTEALGEHSDMPTCRYEVLSGGPQGAPVKFAQIGDKVYHKWTCAGGSDGMTHCMTVHTCIVDDGQGERRVLLDADGCSQDRYLLQNLDYMTPMMAGQEAHVFKFADRPTLYFSCQIKMMPIMSGESCERAADRCPQAAGFDDGVARNLNLFDSGNDFPTPGPFPSGEIEIGERRRNTRLQDMDALVLVQQHDDPPIQILNGADYESNRRRELKILKPQRLRRTTPGNNNNNNNTSNMTGSNERIVRLRSDISFNVRNNETQTTNNTAVSRYRHRSTNQRSAAVPGQTMGSFLATLDTQRLGFDVPVKIHPVLQREYRELGPNRDQSNVNRTETRSRDDLRRDTPVRDEESIDMDVSSDAITVLDILEAGDPRRHNDHPANSRSSPDNFGIFPNFRNPFDNDTVTLSKGNFGLLVFTLIFFILSTVTSIIFAAYTRYAVTHQTNKILRAVQ